MEQLYRAFQLHQLLITSRIPPSLARCLEHLECSKSTSKRIVDVFRDELHAPLIYDRKHNGYRYNTADGNFSLPGFWFNQSELFALLMAEQLFDATQDGVLTKEISRLKQQIRSLLGEHQLDDGSGKIRVETVARQILDPKLFLTISRAVLTAQQVNLQYCDSQNQTEQRRISPQYLLWYRDNWYLVAWCHLREGIRILALSRMKSASLLDFPAIKFSEKELTEKLGNGYGIFTGNACYQAELLFEPRALPWVANVQWHPDQQQILESDGRLKLILPYSDHRELLRDILRFSGEVEVLNPPELREIMIQTLQKGLSKYEK